MLFSYCDKGMPHPWSGAIRVCHVQGCRNASFVFISLVEGFLIFYLLNHFQKCIKHKTQPPTKIKVIVLLPKPSRTQRKSFSPQFKLPRFQLKFSSSIHKFQVCGVRTSIFFHPCAQSLTFT